MTVTPTASIGLVATIAVVVAATLAPTPNVSGAPITAPLREVVRQEDPFAVFDLSCTGLRRVNVVRRTGTVAAGDSTHACDAVHASVALVKKHLFTAFGHAASPVTPFDSALLWRDDLPGDGSDSIRTFYQVKLWKADARPTGVFLVLVNRSTGRAKFFSDGLP